MAKRKNHGYDDNNHASPRPSPHQPQNMNLAQHNQHTPSNRGGRRASGRNTGRSSAANSTPPSPVNTMPPPMKQVDASVIRSSPSVQPIAHPNKIAEQLPKSNALPQTTINTPEPAFITLLPFYYEFITDQCISQWAESGRESVLAEGLKRIREGDLLQLSDVMQEIMRSAMTERLSPAVAGELLRDILKEDLDPEDATSPSRHVVDCFATMTEPGLPNSAKMLEFLKATGINPAFMREQFEPSLLIQLGMVRQTFTQMNTRYSTNVLYKLPTYNLLREDTEGYSKLISEYYHCAERGPPTADRVSETFENVKALIGSFNLDSGRALDVTLDVFGDLLIKRHRFFVRYLRASSFWPQQKKFDGVKPEEPGFSSLPWWTALDYPGGYSLTDNDKIRLATLKETRDVGFWNRAREVGMQAWFELGGRRAIFEVASDSDVKDEAKTEDQADHDWVTRTKTFPPLGNKMAAQLLGYKLRYYASDIRGDSQLPENLIWLAALLIHIGFISLKDLYPHLYPLDQDMEGAKLALMKEHAAREMKKRPGGGENSLSMAKPLTDDTVPPARPREAEKSSLRNETNKAEAPDTDEDEPISQPKNQKIMLVESLLLIGAIPDAMFIIGKFPWMLELQPDITKYLLRIINYSISQIYLEAQPLQGRQSSTTSAKNNISEQAGLPKGTLKATAAKSRKVLKWGKIEESDSTKESDFKFYWDDWSDDIPMCRTVDDVFTLCRTFIGFAGVRIGEDCELLSKIARIGIHSLATDASETNKSRWIDLCTRLLVPALSFTRNNPGPVNQVWELLRTFTITTRYAIYAEWNFGSASRIPAVADAFTLARVETTSLLKRISKQNTKEMAKALAKVSMSSPGKVFQTIISQIEAYDNFIGVIIECARYFTSMGYDVLTWTILTTVGAGGRNRIQEDGMLTSQWLRQLSAFAADVCKRYSVMSPSPMLRYIANELGQGKTVDLEILEQIMSSMAGIKTELSYDASQLQYLTGGPEVRKVVYEKFQDKRFDPPGSAQRLIKSLQESNVMAQILISIAQERQVYLTRESMEDAPLKVLASNMDKIHNTFVQYLDTLRFNLSDEDFNASIPALDRLIKDFGLETPIAFLISRGGLRHKLIARRAERKALKVEKPETKSAVTDVEMVDTATPADLTAEKASPVDAHISASPPDTTETAVEGKAHSVVESLADQLRQVLRPGFEEAMSIPFYIWFWQLEAYDIYYPKATYTAEQELIKLQVMKLNNDRVMNTQLKNKTRDMLMKRQQTLIDETRVQMLQNNVVKRELKEEKGQWFAHVPLHSAMKLSDNILQECIIPRAKLSPQDAFYAAKFIFLMHGLGVVGFRTVKLIDQIFRETFLVNLIFSSTTREVENLGWFLNELLTQLHRWHTKANSKDVKNPADIYNREAFGPKDSPLPGFYKKILPDSTPDTSTPLDWEDFRRILSKWHLGLSKALKSCLENSEYMYIRNAIVLLKIVQSQFPRINYMGNQLMACITAIQKGEERADLKLSAVSLLVDMKKKEKNWILPQAFAIPRVLARPGGADTPTISSESSKALNPAVPAFKPSEDATASVKAAANAGNSEDGEVVDKNNGNPQPAEDRTQNIVSAEVKKDLQPPGRPHAIPSGPASQSRVNEHDRQTQRARGAERPSMNGQSNGTSLLDARGSGAQHITVPTQHALPSKPGSQVPSSARFPRQSAGPDRPPIDSRASYDNRDIQNDRNSASHGQRGRDRTPEPSLPQLRQQHRDPLASQSASREASERAGGVSHGRDSRQGRTEPEQHRDRGFDLSRSGPEERSRTSHVQASSATIESRAANAQPKLNPRDLARQPREPLMNPERASQLASDQMNNQDRRPQQPSNDRDNGRQPGDDRNERISRTTRHPRHDHALDQPSFGFSHSADTRQDLPAFVNDRTLGYDRGHPADYPRSQDRREEQSSFPPSGPRSDRNTRHDSSDHVARTQDLFQSIAQSRPSLDQNHGRLNQDGFANGMSRPLVQEPSYGRLNGPDTAPSGPRAGGPRGQSARNFTAPVGRSQAPFPSPGFERPAPTGPNQDQRDQARFANESTGSYVQPSQPQSLATNEGIAASNAIGIHPSRLGHMAINISAPAAQQMPSSPSYPPSGPRHRQAGANVPSPTMQETPSGGVPQDRRSRSARNPMLDAVNSTLQQGGSSSTPRGRGGRNQSSGPLNIASSPVTQQFHAPLPQVSNSSQTERHDLQRQLQPPERHDRSSHEAGDQQQDRSDGGRSHRRREGGDRQSSQRHRSRSPRRDRENSRTKDDAARYSNVAGPQPRDILTDYEVSRNHNVQSGPPSDRDNRHHGRGGRRSEHVRGNNDRNDMMARDSRESRSSQIPRPHQAGPTQSRAGDGSSTRGYDKRHASQADLMDQRTNTMPPRSSMRNGDQDSGRSSRGQHRQSSDNRKRRGGDDGAGPGDVKKPRQS